MAVDKEQVRELLGSGLGPETVASAVGCDVSYVSQLLADEVFAGEVSALRTVALQSYSKRDSSINAIEDKLLDKLAVMIEDNAFYKPKDILHAAATVNRMVRRGVVNTSGGAITVNNIVQLTLPQHVVRKFTTNRTNEVVEVEGQTLVTMPAHQLLRGLAENSEGKTSERYKEAAKYLPSGSNTVVRGE